MTQNFIWIISTLHILQEGTLVQGGAGGRGGIGTGGYCLGRGGGILSGYLYTNTSKLAYDRFGGTRKIGPHGLSQQGVWVSFWTPKPLKNTPQDT